MNSKGIELTMNTIVVAVLSLIVLVVLVFIIRYGATNFTIGVEDCVSKGGKCIPRSNCGEDDLVYTSFNVCEEERKTNSEVVCCISE